MERFSRVQVARLEAALQLQVWTRANSRRIFELAVASDEAQRAHVLERMKVNSERADQALAQLQALVDGGAGRARLAAIEAARAALRASYGEVQSAVESGDHDRALRIIWEGTDARIDRLNGLLVELVAREREELAGEVERAVGRYGSDVGVAPLRGALPRTALPRGARPPAA
jgi:hypothetical protein